MLRPVSTLLLALALMATVVHTQAPQPPAGRGGGRGGPAYGSPEIGSDRTITFRYLAPNAQAVTVGGELDGKRYPMTKMRGRPFMT